jgi:hypothetical protein
MQQNNTNISKATKKTKELLQAHPDLIKHWENFIRNYNAEKFYNFTDINVYLHLLIKTICNLFLHYYDINPSTEPELHIKHCKAFLDIMQKYTESNDNTSIFLPVKALDLIWFTKEQLHTYTNVMYQMMLLYHNDFLVGLNNTDVNKNLATIHTNLVAIITNTQHQLCSDDIFNAIKLQFVPMMENHQSQKTPNTGNIKNPPFQPIPLSFLHNTNQLSSTEQMSSLQLDTNFTGFTVNKQTNDATATDQRTDNIASQTSEDDNFFNSIDKIIQPLSTSPQQTQPSNLNNIGPKSMLQYLLSQPIEETNTGTNNPPKKRKRNEGQQTSAATATYQSELTLNDLLEEINNTTSLLNAPQQTQPSNLNNIGLNVIPSSSLVTSYAQQVTMMPGDIVPPKKRKRNEGQQTSAATATYQQTNYDIADIVLQLYKKAYKNYLYVKDCSLDNLDQEECMDYLVIAAVLFELQRQRDNDVTIDDKLCREIYENTKAIYKKSQNIEKKREAVQY